MQRFGSKKEWWVVAFVICLSGLLIQLLLTMYARGTLLHYPIHSAVYLLTIVLIWWPLLNTTYRIDSHHLYIRSLFFNWKIPLENIQSVSKTNYFVTAPALSLDRLKIEYLEQDQTRSVIISPKKQQMFIQHLQQAIPHLTK
ncbi:hypothetical protein A3K93_00670 [Acinetobacter sp. NCu2D-2]|uniref:PH domain-containing protein n=1 Tax=Acinetobacter sp. NCu2D-2 TaxID=1608473 RepID=UPI0007CDDEEC|nr:PH domain-containing protein [Acinetobacter sp. NCu2D-2]ANF80845.1 hypothetical protein A3K93_00670 [Acinetobacter sp. NCu2D-2]